MLSMLLSVLALAGPAPLPADFGPTWSPGGLQIAYSHTDDNSSLVQPVVLRTLNLDGSPGRTLVHPTGTADTSSQASDAAWSPDGKQIAFTFADPDKNPEASSIFLANLDGRPSSFSLDGLEPDWSPDSSHLVYSAFGDIWTADRDAGSKRRLTATTAFELEPAWSRDGAEIAYLRDDAIWTMKADGTGQQRVARGTEPTWGPAGLAYVRGGRVVSGGRSVTPAGLQATGPSFSRDGTKLGFAGDGTDCDQPGIFVAAWNGSGLERLTGRDCRIRGTGRADVLTGTPARDIFFPGGGRDRINAGAGDDDVHARDGARDTISCGPGHDTVFADKIDKVARDCELVQRR